MFVDISDNGEEEDIELPTLVHYDGYDYTQHFTIIDDETSEGNVFINYNFGSGCRQTTEKFMDNLLNAVDEEVNSYQSINRQLNS